MRIIIRTGPNSFMEMGVIMWLIAAPFLLLFWAIRLIVNALQK